MFDWLSRANYLVHLKWKQGERRAASSFRGNREDAAFLFDMPPAGAFDHEEGRVLLPTEHIQQFGPKLFRALGRRPVFIDAAMVDDELHRKGLSAHPLTELLERARLAGALALPVTGPGRSKEYQLAVRQFCVAHPNLPICFRIDAGVYVDDARGLERELRLLVFELECQPSNVLLDIDFGALNPHDVNGFSDLLVEWLNALPYLHDWKNIALSLTAFPERPKVKAGQVGRFPRNDWAVYKRVIAHGATLLRHPMYGDYAVEYPGPGVVGQIVPVAQFRYTWDNNTVIYKGASVKKPNGLKAILPVADALVDSGEFSGPEFSLGDKFIQSLKSERSATGNASTWRWATTDHHLTQVLSDLRQLRGLPAYVEPVSVPVMQPPLL